VNGGAVARFHAAQTRLLSETYDRAWLQGVRSYEPDPDPGPGRPPAAAAGLGAGAALLAAQARPYHPPSAPDPQAQAAALGAARQGLDSMVSELSKLTPSPENTDAAEAAARAGDIGAADISQYADALAVQDWAEANAWRLDAGESVAWAGEQHGYAQAADADGQLLEWLPEADDRVCEDCEGLGQLPPMPLADWPTTPGAGDTACSVGCRCVLQVSDAQVGPTGELPDLDDKQEALVSDIAERRAVAGRVAAAIRRVS